MRGGGGAHYGSQFPQKAMHIHTNSRKLNNDYRYTYILAYKNQQDDNCES